MGAEGPLAGSPEEAGRALGAGADRTLLGSSGRRLTLTCRAPSGLVATAGAAPSSLTGAVTSMTLR
eukprot:6426627-Alexandrium_andersonii.AAC.1